MIGIIDYGMGNLHSVRKAFIAAGAAVDIVTTAEGIRGADKIVLPGVGAFRDAIATLEEKKLIEPILESMRSGKWFLGICLGLQLLFDESEEDGRYKGLGVISGRVIRFDFGGRTNAPDLKIPHMGWNALDIRRKAPIYHNIASGAHVYFVHSYYVAPTDDDVVATTTDHGGPFVSSIWKDNVMAVQFHPEKSQVVGLKMLENFAKL
ncbi:MAG: imidazole glycerol phosphate synthase subunit HisH [Sedimentisphaerales bacterium]|nr:imidazole glycerol phosphate synthase subunit HisH [Sedimentisphaerales bacterium]